VKLPHFRKKFPFLVAFVTGMCIMAIELTASRLLAPFFGTSLFVWTNVIAVIMAALAIGYWLGGRLSERRPEGPLLLKIILLGGMFSFFIPFVTEPLSLFLLKDMSVITSASWLILLGSFCATLLLFFIPIMLLGMTSPFIIKILSMRHSDIGNVAGTVFAVSTIGSIVGTFLPAIIFIAWLGSKKTIMIFAVILIVMAAFGLARHKKYWLFFLVFAIGPLVMPSALRIEPETILETESVYQYIQVQQRDGVNYLMYNEGTGTQSVYDPDNVLTGHMYFDIMAFAPAFFDKDDVSVLNIGLAGGTAVRSMTELFRGWKNIVIDGVEIDERVVEIAKKYFGLNLDNLNIDISDGRIFLRLTEKKYDLILVDAYSNQIYIPWHLTTDEFFLDVSDHLDEGGVVALNLNATSTDSKLYRGVTNTMAHNFEYVYSVPIPRSLNYVIFASHEPIKFKNLMVGTFYDLHPELIYPIIYTVEYNQKIEYNQKDILLTDDRAPVEHMTDQMYTEYIFTR